MDVKQHSNIASELRSCVKVEVDVLGSQSQWTESNTEVELEEECRKARLGACHLPAVTSSGVRTPVKQMTYSEHRQVAIFGTTSFGQYHSAAPLSLM